MYCKECGKEIADNSKFCQFCGKKLENVKSLNLNELIDKFKINISDKTKTFISYYVVWVIINIICFIFYDKYSDASSWLFPFVSSDLGCYDWSEFLLYTILVPYLLYFGIKQYKKYKK